MCRALPLIKKVIHIPYILYYWRLHENNQSATPDSLKKIAQVKNKYYPPSIPYKVKTIKPLKKEPLISIIIPTAYKDNLINKCLNSLEKSTYKNYEVIIVDGGEENSLDKGFSKRVSIQKDFNFSERCNAGAYISSGSFLVFLNDDTEIITDSWLEVLLGLVRQPSVKAASPIIYLPNGDIQVSSVSVYPHGPTEDSLNIDSEVISQSICGACFMIRKGDFEGFNLKLPNNYNDTDFGLRLDAHTRSQHTFRVLHTTCALHTHTQVGEQKSWSTACLPDVPCMYACVYLHTYIQITHTQSKRRHDRLQMSYHASYMNSLACSDF
jgi:hypothetical protein